MDTVYIVTEGDYSDYHIIGVFAEEEVAREVARGCGGEVESYTLEDRNGPLARGLRPWFVTMTREGDTRTGGEGMMWLEEARRGKLAVICIKGVPLLQTWMWARDQVHAVKIANERRIRLLAAEAFIPGLYAEIKEEVQSGN